MQELAPWYSPYVEPAALAAIVCGLGALLAVIILPKRHKYLNIDIDAEDETTEEKRLRLALGDAKVMADLAIQRHWTDDAFRLRFLAQPCWEILAGHFSEKFCQELQQVSQPEEPLAEACLKEVELLERA